MNPSSSLLSNNDPVLQDVFALAPAREIQSALPSNGNNGHSNGDRVKPIRRPAGLKPSGQVELQIAFQQAVDRVEQSRG